MGTGQAVQGKVFHPDAGVEKLRLVAGHEERGRTANLGEGFAGLLEISTGGGQRGLGGMAAQLGERTAQNGTAALGQTLPIDGQLRTDLAQTRLGQDAAVFLRRLEARSRHRQGLCEQTRRRGDSSACSLSVMTRW